MEATPIRDAVTAIAVGGVAVSCLAMAGATAGEMIAEDFVNTNVPFALGSSPMKAIGSYVGGTIGGFTGAAVFEGTRRASQSPSPRSAGGSVANSAGRTLQLNDLRRQLGPSTVLSDCLAALHVGQQAAASNQLKTNAMMSNMQANNEQTNQLMANMQSMMSVIGGKFGEIQADNFNLRKTVTELASTTKQRLYEQEQRQEERARVQDRQLQELQAQFSAMVSGAALASLTDNTTSTSGDKPKEATVSPSGRTVSRPAANVYSDPSYARLSPSNCGGLPGSSFGTMAATNSVSDLISGSDAGGLPLSTAEVGVPIRGPGGAGSGPVQAKDGASVEQVAAADGEDPDDGAETQCAYCELLVLDSEESVWCD